MAGRQEEEDGGMIIEEVYNETKRKCAAIEGWWNHWKSSWKTSRRNGRPAPVS
jgi:hypothetical protein